MSPQREATAPPEKLAAISTKGARGDAAHTTTAPKTLLGTPWQGLLQPRKTGQQHQKLPTSNQPKKPNTYVMSVYT